MKTGKAFSSSRDCQIVLTFPNGNSMSTIWGFGSYSDNHFPDLESWDMTKGAEFGTIGLFHSVKSSDTVEVMYEVDPATQQVIDQHFPEGENLLGYLTLNQWLELVSIISGKHTHD